MRNISLKIVVAGIMALTAFTSCSDWTDPSSINIPETSLDGLRDDAYYAALRKWKADPDRRVSFVWFDAWTGGTAGGGALSGLPDSLIIASNWGSSWPLTESQIKDMRRVQEIKGTKVVVTLLAGYMGEGCTPSEYMGSFADRNIYWDIHDENNPATITSDQTRIEAAVRKYAKCIYDSVVKYGYDGFDWDYEPNVGTGTKFLWINRFARTTFIDELSYWFGRGSQRTDRGSREPAVPGLLLQIDGEITSAMDEDWPFHFFDHFIVQSYGCTGKSDLDSRTTRAINAMSKNDYLTPEEIVKRTLHTENFESYASDGGRTLYNEDAINYPEEEELAGVVYMARYVYTLNDMNVQSGGFGIYRPYFDYKQGKGDYLGSSEYWYLRHGISQMNSVFEKRKAQPGWLPNLNYGI
ncbi:MAG: glycoside hydrolase family 18 [Rikenellaceae bacterium]|nr:glycoside hydrolase family 18 [Rikenellaceae bacterium]